MDLSRTTLARRKFLKLGLALTSLPGIAAPFSGGKRGRSARTIDVNVNLGRWPIRRLPLDNSTLLAALLRRHGVVEAWAANFDGLLHKNLADANRRLSEECRRFPGLFVPIGSIHPKLPDWEEELRRCADEYGMPGIRLHPNYHGYPLDDPDFARVLQAAARRGLMVQLAVVMEDARMMHPLLRVEPVNTAGLAGLIRQTGGLRLVLLNALGALRPDSLRDLVDAGEVWVEISMLEGVGGIANLLAQLPVDRVLFGSHAPLFYFESALLKLKESPLSEDQLRAIRIDNARRLRRK